MDAVRWVSGGKWEMPVVIERTPPFEVTPMAEWPVEPDEADERAFFAAAAYADGYGGHSLPYDESDAGGGKARLKCRKTGVSFTCPAAEWAAFRASDERDTGGGRRRVYARHLRASASVAADLPDAEGYRPGRMTEKAVLVRARGSGGAEFWLPKSVWGAWGAGEQWAARLAAKKIMAAAA